jgi:hypothetical protein
MLSRFLELCNSIQKSLFNLSMSAHVSDADFQIVDDLVSTLEPVALTVQALACHNNFCRGGHTLLHCSASDKKFRTGTDNG